MEPLIAREQQLWLEIRNLEVRRENGHLGGNEYLEKELGLVRELISIQEKQRVVRGDGR
jgi:hypothetical protein